MCTVWGLFDQPIVPTKNPWALSEKFELIQPAPIPKSLPTHLQQVIAKKTIYSKWNQYWAVDGLEFFDFGETFLTFRGKKEIPNTLGEMGGNSSATKLSRILKVHDKFFGAIKVSEEMGDVHSHLIEL